jgi:hypothetical protein
MPQTARPLWPVLCNIFTNISPKLASKYILGWTSLQRKLIVWTNMAAIYLLKGGFSAAYKGEWEIQYWSAGVQLPEIYFVQSHRTLRYALYYVIEVYQMNHFRRVVAHGGGDVEIEQCGNHTPRPTYPTIRHWLRCTHTNIHTQTQTHVTFTHSQTRMLHYYTGWIRHVNS